MSTQNEQEMKFIQLILGIGAPVLVISIVRAKLRVERIPATPTLATYLKLVYKPVFRTIAMQTLRGRYRNRENPHLGRFTQSDVKRILERTWRAYNELVPAAQVERFITLGNRQNVLLGVATFALNRALLEEGIQKEYAVELLADLAWKAYEAWIVLPRFIARLVARNPQKQLELMLRLFLRYPFSRPGYDWQFRPRPERVELDIIRCPVFDYFAAQGEEEIFRDTWCTLDFALAQVMTTGGYYERPRTLSAGDNLCEMRWYSEPPATTSFHQFANNPSRTNRENPVKHSENILCETS